MQYLRTRILRHGWVAVLLLLGAGPVAFADPLNQKLSFAEFQALVKQKVGEVPGLQKLWTSSERVAGQTTFTGGAFRGLLLWLHDGLQDHSLAEVRKMKPPSVERLLLQRDADLDLLAPNRLVGAVEKLYPEWDVLDQGFFNRSIADGGSSLDRISASPSRIVDPLKGLREFYDGRLRFHLVARMHLEGNTRVALALRYLRFAKEFERAVSPDARSLALVREIAAEAKLPRNEREEIHDRDSVRYWIKKALSKFFKAYRGDTAGAAIELSRVGLLKPLGESRYFAEGSAVPDVYRFVERLLKKGLTDEEILWSLRLTLGARAVRTFEREARKVGFNGVDPGRWKRELAGVQVDQLMARLRRKGPERYNNLKGLQLLYQIVEDPARTEEARRNAAHEIAWSTLMSEDALAIKDATFARAGQLLNRFDLSRLAANLARKKQLSAGAIDMALRGFTGELLPAFASDFYLSVILGRERLGPVQLDLLFASAERVPRLNAVELLLKRAPKDPRLATIVRTYLERGAPSAGIRQKIEALAAVAPGARAACRIPYRALAARKGLPLGR